MVKKSENLEVVQPKFNGKTVRKPSNKTHLSCSIATLLIGGIAFILVLLVVALIFSLVY